MFSSNTQTKQAHPQLKLGHILPQELYIPIYIYADQTRGRLYKFEPTKCTYLPTTFYFIFIFVFIPLKINTLTNTQSGGVICMYVCMYVYVGIYMLNLLCYTYNIIY